MEVMLWGAGGSILTALIIFTGRKIAGQYKARKKLKKTVEEHCEQITALQEGQSLTNEGIFMLLQISKNKGEINGESDNLFARFTKHLCKVGE